jgi:hypothetical protein
LPGIVYPTIAAHLTCKAASTKAIVQTGTVTPTQHFDGALNLIKQA